MTSETARRNDELRHTEDLLETSQSIIQNFKLQREAALRKQQHVMKSLKSLNTVPMSTDGHINARNSPIQSVKDSYSNPSTEYRSRHISNSYISAPSSICDDFDYPKHFHSRSASRMYSPASFTPFMDCQTPNLEHSIPFKIPEKFPMTSCLTPNPLDYLSYSRSSNNEDYPNRFRTPTMNFDYHSNMQAAHSLYPYQTHLEHKTPDRPNISKSSSDDPVSGMDSQTLIRLLTGPKSETEIEILKELARRERFPSDVIAKLTKSSKESSSYCSSSSKLNNSNESGESSGSDISISTPKNVNGKMRFRVGSWSTSLDCDDDSSVVSSLPTTERAISSERKPSHRKSERKIASSSQTISNEETVRDNELQYNQDLNIKEFKDEIESDAEEPSILSPLPKKSKCAEGYSSGQEEVKTKEIDQSKVDISCVKQPQTNLIFGSEFKAQNGSSIISQSPATYTFKSAVTGEANEVTDDEETSTETPKSFHSDVSGSQSSASTGYRIQTVAAGDRNPFSVPGGIWKYLSNYSAKNYQPSSTDSTQSKEEEEVEELNFNLDALPEFEAEKMNNVLKLSKREKEICKKIDEKMSGIKLLENILKETTEKALLEQRQLSELKKERRDLRKERRKIFSDLSNQPVSESEMPEPHDSRISPLNLTCNSDTRDTPTYPLNRAQEDESETDELQSDRTEVLLSKPSYLPITKQEDSTDTETLSDHSTVRLNFGDKTVRGIIDRVIETENRGKEKKKEEVSDDPLQNNLQHLMQEYLSEMAAHETLQRELRENIPNIDDIERLISQQVQQMHLQAKQDPQTNCTSSLNPQNSTVDNDMGGHLSDVLSARDPPVKEYKSSCTEIHSATKDLSDETVKQKNYASSSDEALFNDLKRQYTFLKDIAPQVKLSAEESLPTSQKSSNSINKPAPDLQEIQANVLRLMNSSASESSTPTTQRSDIVKPKSSNSQTQRPQSEKPQKSVPLSLYESDSQAHSGLSSIATSDLLKRVASESFLHLSSDSRNQKYKRPHSRTKRPQSRRSIDPERSATLKKYLHASSSSDLTDFDSPRLPERKFDTKAAANKSLLFERPLSAAGRIQDS